VKSSNLSAEKLIFKTSSLEGKIYIREQKGVFQRIRRSLSFILFIMFIFIPFIQFDGAQAIYFDLQQHQFHLFSLTLFPQDFFIVTLLLIFSAFLLFYVTKFYGRVWCGFTCPQTIWMLLFNWVERRVEGSHNQSKSLDAQPLSLNKVLKKLVKHIAWLVISLFTALAFISYFVEVKQLYQSFFSLQASSLVVCWVLFFTGCTYINAGWIREKMCQHMCPYARFQSAMFDNSTKLVTYDEKRGESRGKRKRSEIVKVETGDCVDCNLCVQVCPVGIDIRNGLQYECINCGLCVDACDMTMTKFNYKKGLIKFNYKVLPHKNWKRHLSYGGFLTLFILMIGVWTQSWHSFEVSIFKDRQALYRVNQYGNIENTFVFKIRNKSNSKKSYEIDVEGLANAQLIGEAKVDVLPRELKIVTLAIAVNSPLVQSRSDITFDILDVSAQERIYKQSSFYSGSGGW